MSGGVGLYSDYTQTILCIVVKKKDKTTKTTTTTTTTTTKNMKMTKFLQYLESPFKFRKKLFSKLSRSICQQKDNFISFSLSFFFSKECSVCFWSYFLFFHNINCTRHERQEKAKKGIKKYKWLNLHSRHTFLMKATEYISIRRYIDSLLQSVKLIKGKILEMLKFTAYYNYISNLQKYIKM